MKYTPHTYQDHATQHIIDNNYSGLFLEMGLGKTVSTLTAVNRLLYDYCTVNKVLVVAPKRVAENTWTDERDKWDHLKGLRMVRIMGDERKRKEALKLKADIYLISRDMVAWLVTHVESNGFKVNGNPKYTYSNMEVLYSEHDIVGSLAKSYSGVPQDV